MSAAPRYATPRNPARTTDGPAIAAVAQLMGKRLMPWQRTVVDVATERDDDGRLVYELVLVTVPRQSGKTTLVWPLVTHRALTCPSRRLFFTAQTQQDARRRFKDFASLIDTGDPRLGERVRFTWSMSDTGARFTNGAEVLTFPPTETAIHGETPPLVVIDEIFSLSEELGDAILEGAILPAQSTLAGNRQVWLISTAGDATSRFMRKWVERGRKGDHPRLAYFEWSMEPGADPYSPAVIAGFHPAVGHTTTAEDLLALRPSSLAAWLRPFCNVWLEAADPLIPLDDWDQLARPADYRPPSPDTITIGFEADLDGLSASVMAAWRDEDGTPQLHTLHTAPGTDWVLPFVSRINDTWRPRALAADYGGATRRLVDEARLAGMQPVALGGAEFSTACETLLNAARTGRLRHDGSTTLRRGIAGAVLQRTGDTSRISRSRSTGRVAGLIAAAAALRAHDHAPAPLPKPQVTF